MPGKDIKIASVLLTAKRHEQYDFERFNLVECFHRKTFQTYIYIYICCTWHILNAGHKSLANLVEKL